MKVDETRIKKPPSPSSLVGQLEFSEVKCENIPINERAIIFSKPCVTYTLNDNDSKYALHPTLQLPNTTNLLRELKIADSNDTFCAALAQATEEWKYGRSELSHWIDVLNRCDQILENAVRKTDRNPWAFVIDEPAQEAACHNLLIVLEFTALLYEHTTSRHLYNSTEYLIALLDSSNLELVLAVLKVLFVFSRRSAILQKIDPLKCQTLKHRLVCLAESWGGKYSGHSLKECTSAEGQLSLLPVSVTVGTATVNTIGDARDVPAASSSSAAASGSTTTAPSIDSGSGSARTTGRIAASSSGAKQKDTHVLIRELDPAKRPADIVAELSAAHDMTPDNAAQALARLRLACNFADAQLRHTCILSRLTAISVLIYMHALSSNELQTQIIYTGLIEELIEVLKQPNMTLSDRDDRVHTEALRALTSILYLDKENGAYEETILTAIEAGQFHGLLRTLSRHCVDAICEGALVNAYSQMAKPIAKAMTNSFCTALFSFIYHLASAEQTASESLSQSGLVDILLQVVQHHNIELKVGHMLMYTCNDEADLMQYINYVTRAVRVLEYIANFDIRAQSGDQLCINALIGRFEHEVNACRREQPFEIVVAVTELSSSDETATPAANDTQSSSAVEHMDTTTITTATTSSTSCERSGTGPSASVKAGGIHCDYHRIALLKAILNFIKRYIQQETREEQVTAVVNSALIPGLAHVISNIEYYNTGVFLNALQVVQHCIDASPGTLLPILQQKGLTTVIMQALLTKEIPPMREMLAELPKTFTSLCTNADGLRAFMEYKPFDKLFTVFLSTKYLPAMTKKRAAAASMLGADTTDTAVSLGSAIEMLMRHTPTLRQPAMHAIIKMLDALIAYGTQPRYVNRSALKSDAATAAAASGGAGSSSGTSAPTTPSYPELASANNEASGEEDEELDDLSQPPVAAAPPSNSDVSLSQRALLAEKRDSRDESAAASTTVVPLNDYLQNIVRFLETILSHNRQHQAEHARVFVQCGGVKRLLALMSMPHLTVAELLSSPALQGIASIAKYLFAHSRSSEVLNEMFEYIVTVAEPVRALMRDDARPDAHCSVLFERWRLLRAEDGAATTNGADMPSGLLGDVCRMVNGIHLVHSVAKAALTSSDTKPLLQEALLKNAGPSMCELLEGVHSWVCYEACCIDELCNLASFASHDDCASQLALLNQQLNKIKQLPDAAAQQVSFLRTVLEASRPAAESTVQSAAPVATAQQATAAAGGAQSTSAAATDVTAASSINTAVASSSAATASASATATEGGSSRTVTATTANGTQPEPMDTTEQQQQSSGAACTTSAIRQDYSVLMHAVRDVVDVVSKCQESVDDLLMTIVRCTQHKPQHNDRIIRGIQAQLQQQQRRLQASIDLLQAQLLSEKIMASAREQLNNAANMCSEQNSRPWHVCLATQLHKLDQYLFDGSAAQQNGGPLLMLEAFYKSGCHQLVFDLVHRCFRLPTDATDLPADFKPNVDASNLCWLVSWLGLVRKLITSDSLADNNNNNNSAQSNDKSKFSHRGFVMHCQERAFARLKLVLKLIPRMQDSRLAALSIEVVHELIRGATAIRDVVAKETISKSPTARSHERQELEQHVTPADVDTLMAMGFSRQLALDALIETGGVQEAADWLLNRQPQQQQHIEHMVAQWAAVGGGAAAGAGAAAAAAEGDNAPAAAAAARTAAQPSEDELLAAAIELSLQGAGQASGRAAGASGGQDGGSQDSGTGSANEPAVGTPPMPASRSSTRTADGSPVHTAATQPVVLGSGSSSQESLTSRVTAGADSQATQTTSNTSTSTSTTTAFTNEALWLHKPMDIDGLVLFARESTLPLCLSLLDKTVDAAADDTDSSVASSSSSMVRGAADLIVAVTKLLHSEGKQAHAVVPLLEQVSAACTQFEQAAADRTRWPTIWTLDNFANIYKRLHLICLLLDELGGLILPSMVEHGTVQRLTAVLNAAATVITGADDKPSASQIAFLGPLLLLIDLYQKWTVIEQRRRIIKQKLGTRFSWLWWDGRQWRQYGVKQTMVINEAFVAGETGCSFVMSNVQCTVNFNTMSQKFKQNGVQRIINMIPLDKPKPDAEQQSSSSVASEPALSPVSGAECVQIVHSCVLLLTCNALDCNTLSALLRLCVRFTRDAELADAFLSANGIENLLNVRVPTDLANTVLRSFVAFLVRNLCEDKETLEISMEKVIRQVAQGSQPQQSPFARQQPNRQSVNFDYAMRSLAPVAVRNAELFVNVSSRVLRLTLPNNTNHIDTDPLNTKNNEVRVLPAASASAVRCSERSSLHVVLNALLTRCSPADQPPPANNNSNGKHNSTELAMSSLIGLVSECVRSYHAAAALIVDYVPGSSGGSEHKAEQTLLASLLDRCLVDRPEERSNAETFMSSLAMKKEQTDRVSAVRQLLITLATANHSPRSQESLVHEMKTAIQRALLLPNSDEHKYAQLTQLVQLLHQMREACPLSAQPENSTNTAQPQRTTLSNSDTAASNDRDAGQAVAPAGNPSAAAAADNSSTTAVTTAQQQQASGESEATNEPTTAAAQPDTPAAGAEAATGAAATAAAGNERQPQQQHVPDRVSRQAPVAHVALTQHGGGRRYTHVIGRLGGQQQPGQRANSSQQRTATVHNNNILRIVNRKRICLDLARIPLYLDISHPKAPSTINAVLKTLEDFVRLINQTSGSTAAGSQSAALHSTAAAQLNGTADALGTTANGTSSTAANASEEPSSVGHASIVMPVPQSAAVQAQASSHHSSQSPQPNAGAHDALESALQDIMNNGEVMVERIDDDDHDHDHDHHLNQDDQESASDENSDESSGSDGEGNQDDEDEDDDHEVDEDDDFFNEDEDMEDVGEDEDEEDEGAAGPAHMMQLVEQFVGDHTHDDDQMETHSDGEEGADYPDEDDEEEEEEDEQHDLHEHRFNMDEFLLDSLNNVFPGFNPADVEGAIRQLDQDGLIGLLGNGGRLAVRERPTPHSQAAATVSEHALLHRSHRTAADRANTARRANRLSTMMQRRAAALDSLDFALDATLASEYMMIDFPGDDGLGSTTTTSVGGMGTALQRQNAVRDRHRNRRMAARAGIDLTQYTNDETQADGHWASAFAVAAGGGSGGAGGGSSSVAAVPSALSRWTEQSAVLDGAAAHTTLTALKHDILDLLETHRAQELSVRAKEQEQAAKEKAAAKKTTDEQKGASTKAQNDEPTAVDDQTPATEAPASTSSTNQPESSDQPSNTSNEEATAEQPAAAAQQMEVAGQQQQQQPTASDTTQQDTPTETVTTEPMDTTTATVPAEAAGSSEQPTPDTATDDNTTAGTSSAEADAATSSAAGEDETEARARHAATVEQYRHLLGDMEVPFGVDAEFLAALPEAMRREVIEDHVRRERVQQLRQQTATASAAAAPAAASTEPTAAAASSDQPAASVAADPTAGAASQATVAGISQEFLDALPPELQEELLAQQRLEERNRQAAASGAAAAAAGGSGASAEAAAAAEDPAIFFESLPPALRQQVLADAHDTVVQALPAPLAQEARQLRARLGVRGGFGGFSTFNHHSWADDHDEHYHHDMAGLFGNIQLTIGARNSWRQRATQLNAQHRNADANLMNGVQLLDKECIAGLLVLFFLECHTQSASESAAAAGTSSGSACAYGQQGATPHVKISYDRLQKIIKNVASHAPSCHFIVNALVAILDKMSADGTKVEQPLKQSAQCGWLDRLKLSTGLGNQTSVVLMGKRAGDTRVHPLASKKIAQLVLDTLISLSKAYPQSFLPAVMRKHDCEDVGKFAKADESFNADEFWSLAARLNVAGAQPHTLHSQHNKPGAHKKGSTTRVQRASSFHMCESESLFGYMDTAAEGGAISRWTPLCRLIGMTQHPVLANQPYLLDRLFKLLAHIAVSIPLDVVSAHADKLALLDASLDTLVQVAVHSEYSSVGTDECRLVLENVCYTTPQLRQKVYELLLAGLVELGRALDADICAFNNELSQLDTTGAAAAAADDKPTTSTQQQPGTLLNRFEADREVVIDVTANRRQAPGQPLTLSCAELQVKSAAALSSAQSNQKHLLRTLQTLILLRDAMRARDAKADTTAKEGEAVESTTAPESQTLSSLLQPLQPLWTSLSSSLDRLDKASDAHASLILKEAAEAFFLVHSDVLRLQKDSCKDTPAGQPAETDDAGAAASADAQQQASAEATETASTSSMPGPSAAEAQANNSNSVIGSYLNNDALHADVKTMLKFAHEHRRILNQVLRQMKDKDPLSSGPFAVLVNYPRLLDFDVKRSYFERQLKALSERHHRDDIPIRVRRAHIFPDSYRELYRLKSHQWKSRFFVIFEGEEGQDAGGLLREWYQVVTREIFNPDYALFATAPGDGVTYMINRMSNVNTEHLDYFKFVGRLIAKAIYDSKLLDCYFTRAFYKHILNKPVHYRDIETEDPSFFNSMEFILENPIEALGSDLTFTIEVDEFGLHEIRELKPGGADLQVTDANKQEYVQLMCQMKMSDAIKGQLKAFLEGFYEVIPRHLIAVFDEHELELLISGLPNIDINDLQAHTDYKVYTKDSPQIMWLWRALRAFPQEDRAKFLQFVTGTSKVPLQGFQGLEGMNGPQRFSVHLDSRSTDRLPQAHTCFNQLDLPAYESYEKLHEMLLKAVQECSEGFGFA